MRSPEPTYSRPPAVSHASPHGDRNPTPLPCVKPPIAASEKGDQDEVLLDVCGLWIRGWVVIFLIFLTHGAHMIILHKHGNPSLKESLQNLQMEYVDLYLIHWPMAVKPSKPHFPMKREDIVPMDLSGVWHAMEECHRLGLAKMIGVSNFTTKKLQELLAIAKIPPAVNQVEMNPIWQQKKLIGFCKDKGIHVNAYSPLGGQIMSNAVLQSEILAEISKARGKSVAQISLRWIYEQGASMVVKSLKSERLKENMEIFNWELSDEDRFKISQIPQHKRVRVTGILSPVWILPSLILLNCS